MRAMGLSLAVSLTGGQGGAGLVPAPVLTWTSSTTDNTPDFSILLTLPSDGDVIELQVSDAADFSGTIDTVDTGDELDNPVLLSAVSLLNGAYYARAKVTRGGSASAWSNTVNVTIAVPAAAPTLAWTTAGNVFTPGFSVTLASYLSGDSIITQVATDSGFSSIVDTITTAYVGANPTLQTGATRTAGTYYARSRIDRGGATGTNSATVTLTLATFTLRTIGMPGFTLQTTGTRTEGVPGSTVVEN